MPKQPDISLLRDALARADFTYEYCDDLRSYRRGEASMRDLLAVCKRFPDDVVRREWNAHVQQIFPNETARQYMYLNYTLRRT